MKHNKENEQQEPAADAEQLSGEALEERPAEPAENSSAEAEKAAEQTPEPGTEEKLAAEIQELKEKLIYLQADYQNYRKRVIKELADARAYGTESALNPFLTVFDFLGMARTAARKSDNIESIRQGLEMIINEFQKAFDELGVKKIETDGTEFNPSLHEAAARENSETVPEGKIIREWSGGFRIGDRLLRPARVVGSAGPAPAGSEETGKGE